MLPFVVCPYFVLLYSHLICRKLPKNTSNSYLLTAQTSMEKSPPTTLLTVDERVCVFVTQVPKKCDIFVCQFMHCQKEEKVEEKRDSKNNVVTKAQPSVMHSMCNSASTFPRLAIRCNTELVMDILSKKVNIILFQYCSLSDNTHSYLHKYPTT